MNPLAAAGTLAPVPTVLAALLLSLGEADTAPRTRRQSERLEPGEQVLERFDRQASLKQRAPVEAFFDLLAGIELEETLARDAYRRQGYPALLPLDLAAPQRRTGEALRELQGRVSNSLSDPTWKDQDRRLLARLVLDVRLDLREELLTQVQVDRSELAGALALLHAAARGFGELRPEDRECVVRRANLAARRLEAALADLRHLQRPWSEAGQPHPDELGLALHMGVGARTEHDRQELLRILRWREQDLAGLRDSLSLPAHDREHAAELRDRAAALSRSRSLFLEVARLVPFTDQAREAPPEIATLSDSERFARALELGLEALSLDPFDSWLRYLTAEALHFRAGIRAAAAYFDHFLVLRGIRYYDHRTFVAQNLSRAEIRALDTVTRVGR